MRVDLSNLTETTQKSTGVQKRESGTVLIESSKTKEVDKTGKSYRVKNVTYEKPLTEDETNLAKKVQEMQGMDPQTVKQQMGILANTTTEKDYEKMLEDGLNVKEEEIPVIVTEMDKIKIQLAKAGVDISIFGDSLDSAQIEEVLGTVHLPATKENVTETKEALAMAESLENPSDGAIKYLLDNELEPTIDNLYKAEHSGSNAYVPQDAEQIDFKELDIQIEKVLEENGFEVSDENMEDGRWLVQNEIPLTKENLENYQELKALQLPAKNEEVMMAVADAVMQGKRPKDAILTITERRKLEEARLEMSAKANYAHLDKDMAIDTESIAKTVDALKEAEESYYKNFLTQGGVEPTEENIKIYQNIEQVFEELKNVPAYTLGRKEGNLDTPNKIHEEGRILQDTFEKANESYETLMTAPRKDMGDSIQKAFRNVDDILADLELEPNQMNQRAVRILAYNEMEITVENVTQMKALDEKVQQTFQNMTPSVVREMIKTGVNPLDLSLDELNQAAVEIKDQLGIDNETEKFSRYLYKLEQNGQIAEEERSAFIGIYRLIAQVEKTDGAAIGMLAQQGAEFTMRNLLTAVRNSKKEGKEYTVDDEFGGLEDLEKTGVSITEQIEAGYQNDCLKDVARQISPEKMAQIQNWEDMTPEQLKHALEQLADNQEIQKSYVEQEIADYRAAATASEDVYKMLDQYDLPKTVSTVLAAQEMLNNGNGVFRKLFAKAADTQNISLADIEQQILEEFAEAVKTPEDMAKAHRKLAETAENVMKSMMNETEVTSVDLKEMRMIHTQIELGTKMAKEETYHIPVLVGDSVTGVSLKIVRGKEEKGRVDVIFGGENVGKVAAQISAKGTKIEAYIVSDS
ncbi:MAG: DUF6240 domain-containing protein, partial [Lachnospiraceae bacterium]